MDGHFFNTIKESIQPTLETWYLSAVPILIILFLAIINILKIRRILNDIDDTLASEADLSKIKPAINLHMRSSLLYFTTFALFFLGLFLFLSRQNIYLHALVVAGLHTIFLGFATLIISLIGQPFEKRLKNLTVATDNPTVQNTYEYWKRELKRPKLNLPNDTPTPG